MIRPLGVLVLLCALGISGQEKPDCLHAGPMLGYAELNEASVWIQTKYPCRVQLRYWKAGHPRSSRLSDLVETNAGGDHIARFRLTGLQFGTEYDYELYLGGERVEIPHAGKLKTQPRVPDLGELPAGGVDLPAFRVAAGSCAYVDDPLYDANAPHAGGFEIFDSIAKARPDVMLWLGDNVYFREADWLSEESMRARYRRDRAIPPIDRLLGSTRNYACWDDHDFGPNNSDGTFDGRQVAAKVFHDYWMNSPYSRQGAGVHYRARWGDVEFFFVDQRTFRSPNAMQETPEKVMLGADQFRWLIESLRSSEAIFKIVVAGGQMMNPIAPYEGWADFPYEQKRFIEALRKERIEGVMFLSGDRHHTELIRRDEEGLYPLYDLTSSPLTSKSHEVIAELNNSARVPGTLVTQRNFATLVFEGRSNERTVTLTTYDVTGRPLWQRRIPAAELMFPKK